MDKLIKFINENMQNISTLTINNMGDAGFLEYFGYYKNFEKFYFRHTTDGEI